MRQKEKVLQSGPLETFFSGNAMAKIIDFLIVSQEYDSSLTDIARACDISKRTVQRAMPRLLELRTIRYTRINKRERMYQWDKSSRIGGLLEKLALNLVHEGLK